MRVPHTYSNVLSEVHHTHLKKTTSSTSRSIPPTKQNKHHTSADVHHNDADGVTNLRTFRSRSPPRPIPKKPTTLLSRRNVKTTIKLNHRRTGGHPPPPKISSETSRSSPPQPGQRTAPSSIKGHYFRDKQQASIGTKVDRIGSSNCTVLQQRALLSGQTTD